MLSFINNKEHRNFFRFWFAQLISQFGDRVHQMALVGLIATKAPGSSFELAKLLSFTIIPVFIVGPIAGVLVDRWDRRTTMFVCDFIRGLLVLAIAWWLIDLESMVPLYIAVFLIFTLSRFHVPAKMSIIPLMVKTENLHVANSLVSVTGMIAFVAGAVLGGMIVENFGSRGGFLWDAATYFISGLLVFSMTKLRTTTIDPEEISKAAKDLVKAQKNVWTEIKEGIRYIADERKIRFIFLMMTIMFAAAGAVYVVIIVFIQQAFSTVTKDLGFLAIPLGAGLFIGSMAYSKWGGKVSKFDAMFTSLLLGGLMVGIFAIFVEGTHSRGLAMGLAGLMGFVIGPAVIAANTVINQVCVNHMSGKVFAALEFVMHLAFLVSMLGCSLLAEHVARVWILVGVGGIFFSVGIIGLIKYREH